MPLVDRLAVVVADNTEPGVDSRFNVQRERRVVEILRCTIEHVTVKALQIDTLELVVRRHGVHAAEDSEALVPREVTQPVDVDVPAAEDADDRPTSLDTYEPREQSGNGSCRRALHHELAARHDPEQGVEDVAIRQRDDVVDALADDAMRKRSDPFHAKAVDDAIDLVERHDLSLLEAAPHTGRT
jgi:hypothetical protein